MNRIKLYENELRKAGYFLNAFTKDYALWTNINFEQEKSEDIINRKDSIVIKLIYPNTIEIKSWNIYRKPYFIGEVNPDKIIEILNTIK